MPELLPSDKSHNPADLLRRLRRFRVAARGCVSVAGLGPARFQVARDLAAIPNPGVRADALALFQETLRDAEWQEKQAPAQVHEILRAGLTHLITYLEASDR